MRNLKRVLSLALALVMVLGMMVITSSAATFTDADEITYTEAVEVMSAIGVINGIEAADGTYSFNPTATLTREQGAKLLCYLLMGESNAEKLVGSGVFSDVAATRWSAGAIDYCATLGILAGMGDGTFNPTGTLTAVQYGKMLLCALGYDAKVEGYEGKDWATNIAVDMLDAGLVVKGVDFDQNLTREAAAQMTLQALQATMVKYESKGSAITINGVEIVSGASAAEAVKQADTVYADVYGGTKADTLQFSEKYYEYLVKTPGTNDAFGRPASHGWDYYGVPVSNVMKTPVKTYTTQVKKGQLYSDLGMSQYYDYAVDVYVNGADTTAFLVDNGDASGSMAPVAGTGNGVLTEVYKTGLYSYKVVCVETFIGNISAHYDAVVNKDGEVTAKEYVTVGGVGNFVTTAFTDADAKAGGTDVLYTKATADGGTTWTVKSVVAADSAKVVATWMDATSFVAGGETYKYSKNAANAVTTADVVYEETVELFFDAYGYVIDVAAVTSLPNYAIVLANGTDTGVFANETSYYTKLLYADGTTATVEVPASNGGVYAIAADTIVTYADGTGANKGKIVLSVADATSASAISYDTNETVIDGLNVNAKTTFIVQTTNLFGQKVYTVYTGIANVPELTATGIAAVMQGTTAKLVYLTGAALVVNDATTKAVSYVSDVYTVETDVNLGTYYSQYAVVNGEIVTVKTDGIVMDGFYKAYTTNAYSLINYGDPLTLNAAAGVAAPVYDATATEAADNGVIGIGGAKYAYDDATVVYTVAGNGKISVSSVGAIKTDSNDKVDFYTTNNVLTMIVIKPVDGV